MEYFHMRSLAPRVWICRAAKGYLMQAVIRGLHAKRSQQKSVHSETLDNVCSHPLAGFLWSICGLFSAGTDEFGINLRNDYVIREVCLIL